MAFRFIDLFAGIGGMRLAAEAAGGTCVFSSEINAAAQRTYAANFGEEPAGDITKIDVADIPDHDAIFGGFPCQSFSKAGKRLGFEDARGTLFFDIARIAAAKRPRFLVLENVKHLVSHDAGRTIATIVRVLEDLGYTVSWRVLNANRWLPQARERTVFIAHRDGEVPLPDIADRPLVGPLSDWLDRDGDFEFLAPAEYTLLSEDQVKVSPNGLIFCGYRNKAIRKAGVRPGTEHLSRVHKQPNRIYRSDGVHPTLSAQETSGRYFILHDGRVRKMTVAELFRIQGFPEDFRKPVAFTELQRQVGNSVPVPMLAEVARLAAAGPVRTLAVAA